MSLKKEYIHYAIAVVIGLLILFCVPATNGLTEIGVRVIAVMIPTLYLWLTTNTHWTCFLFFILLVMTQAMTPNEVWANSFGHFIFVTIMSFMLLNICLTDNGVIDKIAIFFITRKFCKNRPYVFMAMYLLSHLVLGFFVNGVSLCAIYIGLTEQICKVLKLKKGDPMYTAMFLLILQGNCLVACCSPIGNALPNTIMALCQETAGITITYAQWTRFGVIFTALGFLCIMLIMRIWKPDTTPFENYDRETMLAQDKPLDKKGKISAIMLLVVVAIIILPSIFTNSAFFQYISSLGITVPAIIGIVALCLIRVNGEPVMDLPKSMAKVNFPAVMFACTVACMAIPMNSEATGIVIWMKNILNPLVGNLSDLTLIIVLCVLAVVMTNFLSNTVTEALFFSVGAALLMPRGYNMAAFAVIIAVASGMSAVTPSAAVPSPFFFGPGHVTMKNSVWQDIAFVVLTFICCLATIPLVNIMF